MARHMGDRSQAAVNLYRVVVEHKHEDGRESDGAYGPYMTRGAANGQKSRLERQQSYYRRDGWTTEVHIETTHVEWQREPVEEKTVIRYAIEVDPEELEDAYTSVGWVIDQIDGHLFNLDGIAGWSVKSTEEG